MCFMMVYVKELQKSKKKGCLVETAFFYNQMISNYSTTTFLVKVPEAVSALIT